DSSRPDHPFRWKAEPGASDCGCRRPCGDQSKDWKHYFDPPACADATTGRPPSNAGAETGGERASNSVEHVYFALCSRLGVARKRPSDRAFFVKRQFE